MRMCSILPAIGVAIWQALAWAAPPSDSASSTPPEELGGIHWRRGLDAALAAGRTEKKPILVLFDEVPGCATCKGYGRDVLSHPLIVEAAEMLFVPVAVYNNIKGDDERTLKSFNEPAWNNPVVRIISADRAQLAPRLAETYSVAGLANAMVTALKNARADVPIYLQLLADETAARTGEKIEKATFLVHCFWEGEAKFGALDGVIGTTAGFQGGAEAVEVEFNPSVLSYDALLEKAGTGQCASGVLTHSDAQARTAGKQSSLKAASRTESLRPDKEQKYYLLHSPLRSVPMTGLQAARVNAALARQEDPNRYLSARQVELLRAVSAHPDVRWPSAVSDSGLIQAWRRVQQAQRDHP